MEKHTAPDKWTFTPANYAPGVPQPARVKQCDKVICFVPNATPEVAALLTAAPDLLAELRECVEIMARAVGERLPSAEEHDWVTKLRKAREAVAKAEGRA